MTHPDGGEVITLAPPFCETISPESITRHLRGLAARAQVHCKFLEGSTASS